MNVARLPRKFRTLWISDVHLGTRGCQAEALLAFLRSVEFETLYLVGDIVDGWRLKRGWYWPAAHSEVVQEVLGRAQRGARVIFVPGNHDECARDYLGMVVGGIRIEGEVIHETAEGRRLWVTHGDEFDGVMRYAKWLAFLGDTAYQVALTSNRWFNMVRRRLGMPYWSLSAYLKHKVKNAVQFISNFENMLAAEAKKRGVDGVVCGHIHHAEMREINGVLYCNDGDWVESCTALAEHMDGRLEIVSGLEVVALPVRHFALAS